MMVIRVLVGNESKNILYVKNNNRLRTEDLQLFQPCILPVNGFLLFSIRPHSELFMQVIIAIFFLPKEAIYLLDNCVLQKITYLCCHLSITIYFRFLSKSRVLFVITSILKVKHSRLIFHF